MDKTKLEDLPIQPTPLDEVIEILDRKEYVSHQRLIGVLYYVRDELNDLREMVNILYQPLK